MKTIMKKYLLLLIVFPLIFASCSDDDDDFSNSDIVGSWALQSISAKEVKTNNEDATKLIKEDITSYNEESKEEIIVFSNDGKITLTDFVNSFTGTYSITGNILTFTIDGLESEILNISLSGNTLRYDMDHTEFYQDIIGYLLPDVEDVIVSKVIQTYTLKRR